MRTTIAGVAAIIALVASCARHPPPVVPTSQRQAQDTVIGYLRNTLQALPAGTVFDRSRYAGSGNTPCDDAPTGVPPNEFSDIRDAVFPPGTDLDAMVAKAGDIWRSWGWHVQERDGFEKPNRFGYAPHGYSLHIVAAHQTGDPPTITGVSPCFPGELVRDDVSVPVVLKADS